ncbi:tRNA (adenine(58)-N(1))-methyltransferase catalytic subunit TRMT61A [Sarcoptes scabiei]|uniref:tRNA (adenine(58)-N(1))-methyltransferase catalytic subunit TRMT61A n=2 Tax=Sarcoptes scabiei TaxID=52283 RepID=A0A834R5B4_SARSC|nr:tRNA (adenine(58)-N(1))-methyltransferase catalytic subunit TRMT61A [Sarcoptes scabiei]
MLALRVSSFFFVQAKMSFCKLKNIIEENDIVIIYLSPKQIYPVKIIKNEVFQTRFGALRLDQLIGKPYGHRIECSKGFVHILDMTPDLWTMTLPHRTQILYATDISMILMQLQLRSGSKVIEAGTGSGSLSHSIARTISPKGKLITYDFHEERVLAAREEFKNHGLDHIVVTKHRDVCQNGFDVEDQVDAVFLDLPHPWKAIDFAKKIIRNNGRICCFSPCIEQVQRSCQKLAELKFLDIETIECLLRPYEVKNQSLKKIILSDSESNDEAEDFEENDETGLKNKKIKQMNGIQLRNNNFSNEIEYLTTFMNPEINGHTGFLTFATNLIIQRD